MQHRDCVVILNFGSQYSQSILRRCRELGVYSLLIPYSTNVETLKQMNPKGIILSGGPFSVYTHDSLRTTAEFWEYCIESSIPVFAICYGMQEMVRFFGGEVTLAGKGEYGWVNLYIKKLKNSSGEEYVDEIFKEIKNNPTEIWMSHRDSITRLPDNFVCSAFTDNTHIAAIFDASKKFYGVQFHPEVTHTKGGNFMFKNFLSMLNLRPETQWSMSSFANNSKKELQQRIGKRHVIGALSGGVDSTVAAALIHESIGSQFHGFIVDTGFLRLNEGATVVACLKKQFPDIHIELINTEDEFLKELKGVTCPETKRKKIGHLFIKLFVQAWDKLKQKLPKEEVDNAFLLQGTLYPDIIESESPDGIENTIKSHHNVGGLPKEMNLELLEPLRYLFKDEVRQLGLELKLDKDIVWRHPFPGPGLALRIIGEVTKQRLDILRQADAIFIEELRQSGHYYKIGQAFAVLLPTSYSVGITGDVRSYGMTICLRAVATLDYMTAELYELPYSVLKKCSSMITNSIKEVARVCYDISSKPPATIEWE